MQAVIGANPLPNGVAEHHQTSSRGGSPSHFAEAQQDAQQTADPALATSSTPKNISAVPGHILDAPARPENCPRPFCRMGRTSTSDGNVATTPELEARQQGMQQLGPLPAASASTLAPRNPQAASAPAAAQLQSTSSTQAVMSARTLAAPAAAPATETDEAQAAQLQLAVVAQPVSAAPAAGPAAGHMPADAAAGPTPPMAPNNPTQYHLAPMQAHNMQYNQAPQGHILMMAPGYTATHTNVGALAHSHQLPQRLQPAPEVLVRHARDRYA